jgi:hypothetical protein
MARKSVRRPHVLPGKPFFLPVDGSVAVGVDVPPSKTSVVLTIDVPKHALDLYLTPAAAEELADLLYDAALERPDAPATKAPRPRR